MLQFTERDFEVLKKCPWCSTEIRKKKVLFTADYNCDVVKCPNCSVVFAAKRLGESGRQKYWADYSSRVHTSDVSALEKRKKMYQIDFDYIKKYLAVDAKILDVGCGEGFFLDLFKSEGYDTTGVEFGKEAAKICSRQHKVYEGEFPDLDITNSYDLIIFRGVLQYLKDPKSYLEKAIALLSRNGLIFITAQPNVGSFCFSLFQNNFPNTCSISDFCHYTESILDKYLCDEKSLKKINHAYFYEETPYADIENDILTVAKGIEYRRTGKKIDFRGPAFFGNMMTLVYAVPSYSLQ